MKRQPKIDVSQYNYSNLNYRDFPVRKINVEDFIGRKFGHLLVVKKPLENNNLLTVKCDCGNMNIFPANLIRRKMRTTCGKDCGLKKKKK